VFLLTTIVFCRRLLWGTPALSLELVGPGGFLTALAAGFLTALFLAGVPFLLSSDDEEDDDDDDTVRLTTFLGFFALALLGFEPIALPAKELRLGGFALGRNSWLEFSVTLLALLERTSFVVILELVVGFVPDLLDETLFTLITFFFFVFF